MWCDRLLLPPSPRLLVPPSTPLHVCTPLARALRSLTAVHPAACRCGVTPDVVLIQATASCRSVPWGRRREQLVTAGHTETSPCPTRARCPLLPLMQDFARAAVQRMPEFSPQNVSNLVRSPTAGDVGIKAAQPVSVTFTSPLRPCIAAAVVICQAGSARQGAVFRRCSCAVAASSTPPRSCPQPRPTNAHVSPHACCCSGAPC